MKNNFKLLHLENEEEKMVRLGLLEKLKSPTEEEIKGSGTNNSNQFSFIERANQSTVTDSDDTAIQTDPPPM